MSETEEMPAVPPEEFVNKKELDLAVKTAVVEIQKNEADPVAKAGTAAAELGMMAALGETAKSYLKDTAGVYWKDTKVGVMSFLGIVPLAKELGAPAKAMRAANKAAWYTGRAEKALHNSKNIVDYAKKFKQLGVLKEAEDAALLKALNAIQIESQTGKRLLQALEQGFSPRDALYFADHGLPPKNMVEKGARWIKHSFLKEIPKWIDPFPNVPDGVKKVTDVLDKVSLASSLIALFPPATPIAVTVAATTGIIGTGIPAAWQFMHNRLEFVQVGLKHGKEVAGIVSREVSKKLNREKSPDIQRAAAVFATMPTETV